MPELSETTIGTAGVREGGSVRSMPVVMAARLPPPRPGAARPPAPARLSPTQSLL